ncbi:hypothetical protein ACP275_05G022800 [Erythranthe tilingii]
MAHCLSNMLISQPTSLCPNLTPSNSRFPPLSISRNPSRNGGKISLVKSMADEGRDNLDYLQRQQNQHPKKKSAPVAPMGLWDRFPTARTVQQMLETMERIVDDGPLAYGGEWRSPPPPPPPRTPWEIKEGETEYKMRFDMPGMTKDDVRIWVEENMLVLKAEKSAKNKNDGEDEDGGDEWSVKSYGRYSSRIALPENVEFEKIKAEVKDGVLYLNIPKAKTSPKVFDVNVQ